MSSVFQHSIKQASIDEMANYDMHDNFLVSKIVYMAFVEKYCIKSIAFLLSLEIEIVEKITNEFKQTLKQSKLQGKREEKHTFLVNIRRDEDDVKASLKSLITKWFQLQIRSSINATRGESNKILWYRIRETLKEKQGWATRELQL